MGSIHLALSMIKKGEINMSRYTGPSWKISRRLGYSVLETGVELKKRAYGPGPHAKDKKKKPSEYGKQLIEKQKLRETYGVSERQFRRLFVIAKNTKGVVTGVYFMQMLESRLDNLVYRLGFARTRRQARQLVNHGHILVNGKKVDIPSFMVSVGSEISVKEASQNFVVINYGFFKNIDVIMSASDVIVGKAGGLQSTESIVKGLPIICTENIPAQEKYNIRFIESKGGAVTYRTKKQLIAHINRFLKNPDELKKMSENLLKMRENGIQKTFELIMAQPDADYSNVLKKIDFGKVNKIVNRARKHARKKTK